MNRTRMTCLTLTALLLALILAGCSSEDSNNSSVGASTGLLDDEQTATLGERAHVVAAIGARDGLGLGLLEKAKIAGSLFLALPTGPRPCLTATATTKLRWITRA